MNVVQYLSLGPKINKKKRWGHWNIFLSEHFRSPGSNGLLERENVNSANWTTAHRDLRVEASPDWLP